MSDILSAEERSERMSRVGDKNSKPELRVRSLIHRMGFRFRLHPRELPGKPDIVLPRHKKAVFVHGCFWHRHRGCPRSTTPQNNWAFWQKKFKENIARDRRKARALRVLGWDILVIWECQTLNDDAIRGILSEFFVNKRPVPAARKPSRDGKPRPLRTRRRT